MQEKWKELLSESRENYFMGVKTLTRLQEMIEKMLVSIVDNGLAYQQDVSGMIMDCTNIYNLLKHDIQKILEGNLKITMNGVVMTMPFKEELKALYKNIQKNIYQYLDILKHFGIK